jgi:hypothetical protein
MLSYDYIFIGNFGINYDALKQKFDDASLGDSFPVFFERVKGLADILELEIVEFFDDAVVLKGTAEDVKYIKRSLGEAYCCAYIDESNLGWARECEHGTYTVGEGKPGFTKFKGPQAKSEIFYRHGKAPKYDA